MYLSISFLIMKVIENTLIVEEQEQSIVYSRVEYAFE